MNDALLDKLPDTSKISYKAGYVLLTALAELEGDLKRKLIFKAVKEVGELKTS